MLGDCFLVFFVLLVRFDRVLTLLVDPGPVEVKSAFLELGVTLLYVRIAREKHQDASFNALSEP